MTETAQAIGNSRVLRCIEETVSLINNTGKVHVPISVYNTKFMTSC